MIVSAIPYTGNKRKLWRQIEPLLPECNTFVDLFTGGGTMALNMAGKGKRVFGGDTLRSIMELHNALRKDGDFYKKAESVNKYYPSTKSGYLLLREHYNVEPSAPKLFNLLLRSNSNQCRFNKGGGFNMTYGERNHFNMERLKLHTNTVKENKLVLFECTYLELVEMCSFRRDEGSILFYADPPYTGTTATYNEGGGWGEKEDAELLDKLLQLQQQGYKVAASNVFENKGVVNHRWKEFCEEHKDKFIVHHLDRSYKNSSFRKPKEGATKTDEVLIVTR